MRVKTSSNSHLLIKRCNRKDIFTRSACRISTLNPYKLWTYDLNFNSFLFKKISFSLSGRVSEYVEYFEVGKTKKHIMLNSNAAYQINYKTNYCKIKTKSSILPI